MILTMLPSFHDVFITVYQLETDCLLTR